MTSETEHQRKDRKGWIVLLYLVAFGMLLVLYEHYMAPVWGYRGFEFQPNAYKVAAGTAAILFFVLLTPVAINARSFFLNFILTTYLLPSMVIYGYGDKSTSSALLIWGALLIVYAVSAIPIARIVVFKIRTRTLMWLIAAATICLMVAFYVLGGARYFNLDISRVYDFRRDAAEELPGIFGYLSPTFGRIVIPFGLAVALVHRKYVMAIIFFGLAVLLFGFTSHKSFLFTPLLIMVIFFVLSRDGRYIQILAVFICVLSIGIIDMVMISSVTAEDSVWGWYNSLFIRRTLMVPAMTDYFYMEFFSENPQYYWASSRVSLGLVQDPYGIVAPRLIGEVYYGSSETNANSGFIGSGYAQAGVVGVILYSIGIGLTFSILAAYGRYMGFPFIVATTIDLVRVVTSADFLTLFLTQGMLILLLLISMARSPQEEKKSRSRQYAPSSNALVRS